MKFDILASKKEAGATCYLVSSTLGEYLSNLPKDYNSFEIQRSIVSNAYLDRLVNTVLSKGHIPIITLIAENATKRDSKLSLQSFKILDGLQRTHRLKLINDTKNLYLKKVLSDSETLSDFQLKRKYRNDLNKIGSSGNLFTAIKTHQETFGSDSLDDCFAQNSQWFEIWVGLTPNDQVKKMLLLNAGHKAVNIKHQLELLFQNLLPMLHETSNGEIEIFREKELSSTKYSKERERGSYHFSHIVS